MLIIPPHSKQLPHYLENPDRQYRHTGPISITFVLLRDFLLYYLPRVHGDAVNLGYFPLKAQAYKTTVADFEQLMQELGY